MRREGGSASTSTWPEVRRQAGDGVWRGQGRRAQPEPWTAARAMCGRGRPEEDNDNDLGGCRLDWAWASRECVGQGVIFPFFCLSKTMCFTLNFISL
jgi:hypothetical protein